MLLFLFRTEWSSWWLRIHIQPLTVFSLEEIRTAGLGSRSCSVSFGLMQGQIQGRGNFWSEVTEFTDSTWRERRGGQEPLPDTDNIMQNARMWHCPAHRSRCSELKPSTATQPTWIATASSMCGAFSTSGKNGKNIPDENLTLFREFRVC